MSERKFNVGDRVYHYFSDVYGIVQEIRDDPHHYDYLVAWEKDGKTDWYRAGVLRLNKSADQAGEE